MCTKRKTIKLCISIIIFGFLFRTFTGSINDFNQRNHDTQQKISKESFPRNVSFVSPSKLVGIADHQQDKCAGENVLVAVMSAVEARRDRQMIRSLWGNKSVLRNLNIKLLFFIGNSFSNETRRILKIEIRRYSDIMFLDIEEGYNSLVDKSVLMMKWFAEHCPKAQWYVKCDSDAFWNIYELNRLLLSDKKKDFLENYALFFNATFENDNKFTYLPKKEKVVRKPENLSHKNKSKANHIVQDFAFSKIQMNDSTNVVCAIATGLRVCRMYEEDRCEERYIVSKEEYPSEEYPPHCHGYSYVLRRDLVEQLLDADARRLMRSIPRFRMEDVYITGILAEDLSVNFIDISTQELSFPKYVSETLSIPLLLVHGPEKWLLQGSARQFWEHLQFLNQKRILAR